MDFYLGTHMPNWLGLTDVPLMVSHRRLHTRKSLPKALGPWALDSGGFTELSTYGEWGEDPFSYVVAVRRYAAGIGNMAWAAPQDWMCEPFMVTRTGMSVREHQERTVDNFCELRAIDPALPFMPVLQGWELADYRDCLKLYDEAGVALNGLVGVGSVCRRQNMDEASHIMRALSAEGLRLHGFGFKVSGLRRCRDAMASADSMAWSYRARRGGRTPLCRHRGSCSNCLAFALRWREQVARITDQQPLEVA